MTADRPPLTLHGYPVSNYVNVVRAALIEKGLEYTLSVRGAAQDEAFLSLNPMGKIPVLETEEGALAETVAILEYLDDRYPARALRPTGAFAAARARQIVNLVQVYVEVPTRSLFPGVFMGGENSPPVVVAARATLDRASAALVRLARPAPFLLGEHMTNADLFAFYSLDISDRLGRFVWGRSMIAECGLEAWSAAMRDRSSTKVVLADFEADFARYLNDKGAIYRAPDDGRLAHA
ncbi:glutathione S-transferase family protein [Novosphingobium sp. JCM 18896]|uniref:glutathione S-transferase family protein n=1 Tax=Novosphingobium sp. JCM 18896 TaxID=2989731 RepID=UPI0022226E5D|nr:glutathione S-transferase family protein [Novosphingobium sp. JCM 18896]MCW1432321.1 glutathione S-transferase family protein [Novosphingobium sp. JCM 18896]